jgi:2-keto-4-pentenoate hydratase/2-oxohepta-3-ene-1,7-dioic acid hydratase in catechol pathway
MRIARFSHGGDVAFGVVEGDDVAELAGHPFGPVAFTGNRWPLTAVRLLAPVLPSKVVAIGKNYAEHATEMGGDVPEQPLIFLKPSTAVAGPGDQIAYPESSQRVDYEGELAVVIGRLCRDVPVERAEEVILGYTCGNDVTARDQQKTDGQWSRAKGYDTFCPIGPWIVTDVDPGDLDLRTEVNGEVKQHSRTSLMIHDIGAIVEWISAVMTLLPGDLILTGTPDGVGPIEHGDTVSITIEGIGTLSNPVVRKGN